jgi:hypothetical protein
MTLEYISGYLVSQDVLAKEMMTSVERGGADLDMVRVPFVNRGYVFLDEHRQATSAELKEHNSLGHVAIINIHFDTSHKAGHYVLVIGYNPEGIFVHDPWPSAVTVDNRKTGKEAFISDLLLSDLWSRRNNWVLKIYPTKGSQTTSASGLTLPFLTTALTSETSIERMRTSVEQTKPYSVLQGIRDAPAVAIAATAIMTTIIILVLHRGTRALRTRSITTYSLKETD